MFNWLREKLGFTDLARSLIRLEGIIAMQVDRTEKLQRQIGAVAPGIGRVIAKIDPMYGRDELDPKRRAESDAIGEAVMKKLLAEHNARNPT